MDAGSIPRDGEGHHGQIGPLPQHCNGLHPIDELPLDRSGREKNAGLADTHVIESVVEVQVMPSDTLSSDTPLSFESPDSSNIERAEYLPEVLQLRITFKGHSGRDGREYSYEQFPLTAWVEFEQASSKGSHFAQRIRPFYVGRRL